MNRTLLGNITLNSRRWLPWLLGIVAVMISGCFRYDLAIQFDSQTQGQIVQQIHLSGRGAALAEGVFQEWLTGLEKQVRTLGGQVRQPTPEEVTLVVPFKNGADLVQRFNQLFQGEAAEPLAIADLGTVQGTLNLEQANRVLSIRNHLTYDLDLRSLPQEPTGVSGALGSTADWLQLNFSLQTPWGIDQIVPDSQVPETTGPLTTWRLQPGQLNHIEVTFWVPSLLGLGGLAIATWVLLGYFLKYGWRSGRPSP